MTALLLFRRIALRSFRNIEAIELEPAPRVNVVAGDNGQGKTSLLEALYFVATSRSFRAERQREMLRDGDETALVRASIEEDGLLREQRATIGTGARQVFVDGKRPERLATFATLTPVVVFHPGDLELVWGSARVRRRLLDRIALYVDPLSADHRARYERAMKSRQVTLERRGPDAPELDALEALMAEHGCALTRAREDTVQRLESSLEPAFASMAGADLTLNVEYVPGGSVEAEAVRAALAAHRRDDLRRKSARFGPHRDDVELRLDGRTARRHASQGQQRLLTLALKSAELECVRSARGAHPVLLLDDVSSELDPTRTGAVYSFLRETPSQVFVTTTRPELFATPGIDTGDRADWRLKSGVLVAP